MPRMASNIEIATRPMTSTSRVPKDRCTSTLSITTWKNSGETRANSCRKNDATSTSLRRCRYLWIAPRNQVMSNRRVISDNPAPRGIRINSPSHTPSNPAPRLKAGPGARRGLAQHLILGRLGDHHDPAIAQRRDRGQWRPDKPRPIGPIGPCLEPEIFGAPEHLRGANLVRSQPMPDLSGIGCNALEMQQRDEGLE